jgi:hypothetical protein
MLYKNTTKPLMAVTEHIRRKYIRSFGTCLELLRTTIINRLTPTIMSAMAAAVSETIIMTDAAMQNAIFDARTLIIAISHME